MYTYRLKSINNENKRSTLYICLHLPISVSFVIVFLNCSFLHLNVLTNNGFFNSSPVYMYIIITPNGIYSEHVHIFSIFPYAQVDQSSSRLDMKERHLAELADLMKKYSANKDLVAQYEADAKAVSRCVDLEIQWFFKWIVE